MNVLLVEDNEADRRAIREAFRATSESVTLHAVEDGESALQFITQQGKFSESPNPDLILLDLNLPGTHGRDVLREIKTSPETKNIPIIVLTSSNFQGDICECYDLNANCYINKPMRYSELLKLVNVICEFWVKEVRYCH
jgi:two-component system, chemotaxis family, response regulator Rcp1